MKIKIDFINDINSKFSEALGYPQVDRFMIRVLWLHLLAFLILVFTNTYLKIALENPNPFSWRVITPLEATYSIALAFIAVIVPVALKGRFKNHYLWRILITVALLIYSYLFVFISGGSIEMHFHFFIVAALIVMYADWRLGWILLVLTGVHHVVLNYLQPGWVYFYGRNDLSVVSHAVPVVVMVLFTTVICELIRGGVMALDLTNRSLVAGLHSADSNQKQDKQ